MDCQLVQVCCSSGSFPSFIDPAENVSRETVELRAEVERLQRENLEFRQQVGYSALSQNCQPHATRRMRR